MFAVSPSFVVKLMARRRATGSLEALPRGGSDGKLAAHRDFLVSAVEEEPDQTMPELAARLLAARGVVAAPASLSRLLIRCGLTRKTYGPPHWQDGFWWLGLVVRKRIRHFGTMAVAVMEIRASWSS